MRRQGDQDQMYVKVYLHWAKANVTATSFSERLLGNSMYSSHLLAVKMKEFFRFRSV